MAANHLNKRKADHIELTFRSQLSEGDSRFYYEPLFAASPDQQILKEIPIAGTVMHAPIWISSMTGGAELAGEINKNLARAAQKYGLGMGLGSCRPVLEQKESAADFKVRKIIGDQPLFANLGIAQLQELKSANQAHKINELIISLEADGLIIHVNPLQEWFQPEGDKYSEAPIETIKWVLDFAQFPIMVKEVGQGFGPKSLKALLELPLEALDFGSFGGTNFSLLENHRRSDLRADEWKCATHVGHSSLEMVDTVNEILTLMADAGKTSPVKTIIASGGIKNFLDGYYAIEKINHAAIYAQASPFLKYALQGQEPLDQYIESQIEGLKMAQAYLTVK